MSARSPRVQVTLRPDELGRLRKLARKSDLSLSAFLRSRGLDRGGQVEGRAEERALTGLAALVAAEHALVLLEAVLPDGVRRSTELREQAILAAEERLEGLRQHLGRNRA